MQILQINTVYQIKSTGRTCSEIENALIGAGHECCTAYGNGPKNMGPHAYRIDTRLEYIFHNILSRITGLEGYFSRFATHRLIRFIEKYKPDVIHLRNLHGHYLNLPLLFKYLSKADIPVVQNLHDCWAFTGKCAYYTTNKCDKWKSDCGGCPMLHAYPQSYLFDFSKKMKRDKERWYRSVKNLYVVGVSEWVSNEAKQSFLTCAKEIGYIYNWINQDVFKPYPDMRDETRKKYGIPTDKFMILGVSSQWPQGSPRREDFEKMSERLKDDEVLVMVGSMKPEEAIKEKIVHIPFVGNTTELAQLYSAADVYVHCSVEDTFGKVIAEAMSCGTPAIVYAITGCAELVAEGCGYTVEPRNVDEVMRHISDIKKAGKSTYSESCINNVQSRFSYRKNSDAFIRLYQRIADENEKNSTAPEV